MVLIYVHTDSWMRPSMLSGCIQLVVRSSGDTSPEHIAKRICVLLVFVQVAKFLVMQELGPTILMGKEAKS